MLLLALVVFVPLLSINMVPRVHAEAPFSLNSVPAATSEGNTVSLVLSANSAVPNTQYRFRFSVTDPSGKTAQTLANYTTASGQDKFTLIVVYPSPSFQGSNTLVGQFNAKVDELWPTAAPGVAGTSFFLSITDSSSYQRTQTVNVQASGYKVSESVTVTIRTQTTSTLVFSQTVQASGAGVVATSWKIPVNATIDTYVVTLTGTSTVKNPVDSDRVSVGRAIMIVSSITSVKSVYQRTETMSFSSQPTYPDGSIPSTGVALLSWQGL